MNRQILLLIALAAAFPAALFAQSTAESANEPGAGAPIEILKGEYTYDFAGEILEIHADEKMRPTVMIGEFSITADEIKYEQKPQILNATGNVHLWDRGLILRGEQLLFFVEQEEGTLTDVKPSELSAGVYFHGKTLKFRQRPAKAPKDATEAITVPEYTLLQGAVTGNDMPVPYYEIQPSRTVIVPDDRYWAFNLLFEAQSWPLFYLPVFTGSLKEHRIVHIFNASYNSELGLGIYNQLHIRATDEVTIDLYGDYFTDAGIGKGTKVTFDAPGEYGPKGYVYGYHIDQEAPDNDYVHDGDDRYLLAGEYAQDLPYDMRISARGHRFSDSEYRWDYRSPERIREMDVRDLENDVVSHVTLSKWWDDQSLRITAASSLDPFYYSGLPYVERTPQIHFEQYPMRLFDTNLFADLHLDYGRYRREKGYTWPIDKYTITDIAEAIDEVERFDGELQLSYPFYLPGRVTMTPWIGFRGTHYADPTRSVRTPIQTFEFDSATRAMLEGGTELSTRFTNEFDPFLDRYEKMRLVVEPIINYGYYKPDIDLEERFLDGGNVRFPYIDPTDAIRYEMHNISAILRTKIQGQTGAGTTSDFMQFGIGAAYDQFPNDNLRFTSFELFDDPALHSGERYADLLQDFAIYPYSWLSLGDTLRYDVEDGRIRSAYYYANLSPIQRLRLVLGYYTFLYPNLNRVIDNDEQQDAVLQILFDVSKKWQLFYSGYYDVDEGLSRSNNIGIMRDMYDFFTVFQIEHRAHPVFGDDYSFNFRIGFWGIGGRQGQDQKTWRWR
ncbi:MAG: LPS-assembly protein LptD [Candidatus Omnitrophota bacterium]|jgi:lipopolysaccharide assembly outer membrane protein LptD (OstA)|nr:MAG: LPS-assembly protein LptD [Candidatus Omnitrophota bacterium]